MFKTYIQESFLNKLSVPQMWILSSLFLTPALLLCTPNYSVAVVALLVLYSIYYNFSHLKNVKFDRNDYLALAVLSSYFLVSTPNLIIDAGNFRYVDGPVRILLCFPVYRMFKHELSAINFRPYLEYGVALGTIGTFSIAIYQYFFLHFPRVDGFLFSINFGYLACSLAFVSLCLSKNSKNRSLLFFGFVLAVIATFLTLTRGAILAVPVLLMSFIYFNGAKKRTIAVAIAAALIASISTYKLSDIVKERVDFTIQEVQSILSGDISQAASSGARLQLWYASMEAFKQSPLLGLIQSEREELNAELNKKGLIDDWTAGVVRAHAHSQYFEMLASSGVLSLVTVALLFITPLVIFYHRRENQFATAGFVFILGIMFFGLTEVLLQANLIAVYFGFFLSFFLASSEVTSNTQGEYNA